MDLTVNLAPSYRDLKDPTTRQNFDDTVEQKRVIDLRACHIKMAEKSSAMKMLDFEQAGWAEAGIAFQNLFMKFWRRHENLKFYLMCPHIFTSFSYFMKI